MVTDYKKKKSIGFVSGLAFGAAAAAGTVFLYKTKKGRKLRKQLAGHYDDAIGYLGQLLKDAKKHAKKLESDLAQSNQTVTDKTKVVKRRVKTHTQATTAVTRKVFKRLGKPLIK